MWNRNREREREREREQGTKMAYCQSRPAAELHHPTENGKREKGEKKKELLAVNKIRALRDPTLFLYLE